MGNTDDSMIEHAWPNNFQDIYFVCYLGTGANAVGRGYGGTIMRRLLRQASGEGREVGLLTQTIENVSVDPPCGNSV